MVEPVPANAAHALEELLRALFRADELERFVLGFAGKAVADEVHWRQDLAAVVADCVGRLVRDGRVTRALFWAIERERPARTDDIAAVRDLWEDRWLAASPDGATAEPYPGLLAFEERDAPWFFGREDLTERALGRLLPDVPDPGIALLGASGCGKSSLLRAGIVPAMRACWPGLSVEVRRPAELVGWRPRPSTDTLLVVDQLEELFDPELTSHQDEISQVLLDMAARPAQRRLALAIRVDRWAGTARWPALHGWIERHHHLIPAGQRRGELLRMIAEPARRAGAPVPAALAARLADEVVGREGLMPLLQFTLRELWARGGREGAWPEEQGVTAHFVERADGALARLAPGDEEVARRVFLSLVTLGPEDRWLRRRRRIGELGGRLDAPEAIRRVLDTFADRRILSLATAPDGQATAEIVHDAVLERWPRLRDEWLQRRLGDAPLLRRLEEAAERWVDADRAEDRLWSGPDLDDAARLDEADLHATHASFLAASRAKQERERAEAERQRTELERARAAHLEAEQARLESEQARVRAERARVRTVAALVIVAILVVGALAWAAQRQISARDARVAQGEEDLRGTRAFLSQSLARRAIETAKDDEIRVECVFDADCPDGPMQLALRAWALSEGPPDGLILQALVAALGRATGPRGRLIEPGGVRADGSVDPEALWSIQDMAQSPDGRWIAMLDGRGQAGVVSAADGGDAIGLRLFGDDVSVTSILWTDDQHLLVLGRSELPEFADSDGVITPEMANETQADYDRRYTGQVRVLAWDAASRTLSETARWVASAPAPVALLAAGARVAAIDAGGGVRVWDRAGLAERSLAVCPGDVPLAELSPDGERLAVACSGGTVSVWELGSGGRRWVRYVQARAATVSYDVALPPVIGLLWMDDVLLLARRDGRIERVLVETGRLSGELWDLRCANDDGSALEYRGVAERPLTRQGDNLFALFDDNVCGWDVGRGEPVVAISDGKFFWYVGGSEPVRMVMNRRQVIAIAKSFANGNQVWVSTGVTLPTRRWLRSGGDALGVSVPSAGWIALPGYLNGEGAASGQTFALWLPIVHPLATNRWALDPDRIDYRDSPVLWSAGDPEHVLVAIPSQREDQGARLVRVRTSTGDIVAEAPARLPEASALFGSPDGRWVALSTSRGGGDLLEFFELRGETLTHVGLVGTVNKYGYVEQTFALRSDPPSWSPSGDMVSFPGYGDRDPARWIVLSSRGPREVPAPDVAPTVVPGFSSSPGKADGVPTSGGYRVRGGSTLVLLTPTGDEVPLLTATGLRWSVSPDGQTVAVTAPDGTLAFVPATGEGVARVACDWGLTWMPLPEEVIARCCAIEATPRPGPWQIRPDLPDGSKSPLCAAAAVAQ